MIRAIQKEDLKLISKWESECFKDAWDVSSLEEELNYDYAYGFLIEDIGYVWVYELYENAEIVRIGITPGHRGCGYAKELMDFVYDHARKNACEQMTLEVRVSNESAISLYKKCGLSISHRSKSHYSDGEDAYVMIGSL